MKLEFESNASAIPYAHAEFSRAASDSQRSSSAVVSEMLLGGIKAAQEGNRAEARALLVQVTEAEPDNENAWMWMASISEYPEELLIFLNNVLSVNPNNQRAVEWAQATKSLLANAFVQRGVDAANAANKDVAKQCFWQAIGHDSRSETAWMQLAAISDSAEEKISHLQKVLNLNPANESATTLLTAARNQTAQTLLRKANSAAVAGERESAREMLAEVLKHAPDFEDAWILKSYLADSFSEKITCFERVLSLNPENEMAVSGLASLKAMMARSEAKKEEQFAAVSAGESAEDEWLVPNDIADADEVILDAEIVSAEPWEESANSGMPVESELTENFENSIESVQSDTEKHKENFGNAEIKFMNEVNEQTHAETIEKNYGNYSFQKEDLPEESAFGGEQNHTETVTEKLQAVEYYPQNTESLPAGDDNSSFYKTGNFSLDETMRGNNAQETLENRESFKSESAPKLAEETVECPFCNARNEANAFVCNSCRTVLSLSNLEMLLAHTEADQEVLRQSIERMEGEKNFRNFNHDEMKNLAVGHINLKNLRQGVSYLQKASQMNPNDVVLSSQVNSLKIRLAEIEQQETVQSQMSKNRRILIVDDSATVRKLISSKLEKSGHEVVSAVDGIEALEKIKEFTPDLILLDINMPRMDGYQVCKLFRMHEATKDVPIVMISGNDGFFDKVRGRMAGTTGYITKPFGPETLMKTLETYIT
jgi:CheY-like chemotaxis protein/Tfp pilus assembly protein PilF